MDPPTARDPFWPAPPPTPPPGPPQPQPPAPGAPPAAAPAPAWQAPRDPPWAGAAVASLVLGIASLWIPSTVGVVLGTLAIVFAVRAFRDLRRDPGRRGKGLAKAGLVTGILGLATSAFVAVLWVTSGHFALGATDDGDRVAAVEAALVARNLDADAPREPAVVVYAHDEDGMALTFAGTVAVTLERSLDGRNWTAVGNATAAAPEAEWSWWDWAPDHSGDAEARFADVELDGAWFRARAVVTVEETGARFEDLTPAVRGDRAFV